MIDIKKNVEIGKSLAGLQLGSNLSIFLPYIDTVIDGEDVPWTVMIEQNNNGKLLYKIPDNNGFIVYVNMPKLELGFTEKGNLYYIRAGVGYIGEIFKGVKIGSKISEIKNQLYLDDTEDVHYLVENGERIEGIMFFAGGLEVEEDPDAIIEEVKIYNFDIE